MLNGCLQPNHRKYFTILTSDVHIYKQGTVNRILREFWVSISWNSRNKSHILKESSICWTYKMLNLITSL